MGKPGRLADAVVSAVRMMYSTSLSSSKSFLTPALLQFTIHMPPPRVADQHISNSTTIASVGTTKGKLLTGLGWPGSGDAGCQEGRGHRCCGLQCQVASLRPVGLATASRQLVVCHGLHGISSKTGCTSPCHKRHAAQQRRIGQSD